MLVRSLILASACCLGGAPAAEAATATSSNWAGYAVMRSGVSFHRASATWKVSPVDCATPEQQWSAVWVGLGGYRSTSPALEQIGTEADCVNGAAHYSAWYELVPQSSRDIRLTVHPGDRISASVSVTGHRVRLHIANLTTGRTFVRMLTASAIDTSSAEWIVEAPSACFGTSDATCRIMPLANFGTTKIANARATTTSGHTGTIGDPAWRSVAVTLTAATQHFAGPGRFADGGSDSASPSGLNVAGSAFTVTWASS